MGVVQAPALPELYETRRGPHLLIIDPGSGRWWIGAGNNADEGRRKVRHLAQQPDVHRDLGSYETFPEML